MVEHYTLLRNTNYT